MMKTTETNKLVAVQGYPYRTDGGENAATPYGQSIIDADGSECFGEIIAAAPFIEKVIAALNNKLADFPIEKLRVVLGLAVSYLEDITTGLEDGTYDAIDNLDYDDHKQIVAELSDLIGGDAAGAAPKPEADGDSKAALAHKKVTFYFDAQACDDHGDGPQAAKLVVTQPMVDKLMRLQRLVSDKDQPLSELRIYEAPDMWLPKGVEDELRLHCPEMIVSASEFWFTDYPKHANYTIESDAYSIAELAAEFDAAVDGQTVRIGECEFLLELEAEMTDAAPWSEAKAN